MSSRAFSLRSGTQQYKRRADAGQAIAETAAVLPLIIGLAVFIIMIITFVGTMLYYYIELSSVASQLANHLAANVTSSETALTDTQSADLIANANKMLPLLGLPSVPAEGSSNASRSQSDPTMSLACNLANSPAIAVSLKMSGIQFFNGQIPTIPIIGTGVALIEQHQFTHYATIDFTIIPQYGPQTARAKMYVPVYEVDGLNGSGGGSVPASVKDSVDTSCNYIWGSNPKNISVSNVQW